MPALSESQVPVIADTNTIPAAALLKHVVLLKPKISSAPTEQNINAESVKVSKQWEFDSHATQSAHSAIDKEQPTAAMFYLKQLTASQPMPEQSASTTFLIHHTTI